MFVGTTPNEICLLLQDLMKKETGDVFIGCSGNFSSDKIMSAMGLKVHSNDVCLYSKLIADILLGTDTDVKVLNTDFIDVFNNWEDNRYKKLIQVMFTIKISGFQAKKNDYQKEMYDSFMRLSNTYYESTLEKFTKKSSFDFKIESFFYGDFIEHLKSNAGKGIGISFPPTYKGGYEKMFSFVDKSFEYTKAEYGVFNPKNGADTFKELLESGKNIIYSDKDHESISKYKIGKAVLGNNHNSVYVYSSLNSISSKYFIVRTINWHNSKYNVVAPDFVFTDETVITSEVVKTSDVNYFKAFYMANKVNYTTGGDFGIIFLADGKAFGFTSFSKNLSNSTHIFMQSDFVVNSNTMKLSKLLIMLVQASCIRKQISRLLKYYYTGLKTYVFTDKPVSMKYRGVYKLDKRDNGKLIYISDFQNKNLTEIYQLWKKKY